MIATALIINGVLLFCCAACWAWELALRWRQADIKRARGRIDGLLRDLDDAVGGSKSNINMI